MQSQRKRSVSLLEKIEHHCKTLVLLKLYTRLTLPDWCSLRTVTLSRCHPEVKPELSWPIRIFSIVSPMSSSWMKNNNIAMVHIISRLSSLVCSIISRLPRYLQIAHSIANLFIVSQDYSLYLKIAQCISRLFIVSQDCSLYLKIAHCISRHESDNVEWTQRI